MVNKPVDLIWFVWEANDFPWIETVSIGSGNFVPVFQKAGQVKETCDVASATDTGTSETRNEDSDATDRAKSYSSPS